MTIECFAPAKVNLTLHVTGQRADGYHLLDSLVMFADVGDHITFTQGPAMSLQISGPFADGVPNDHRNLVWKAAKLAGKTGAMTLVKNLPHGAGIGGGSSDAGALLRALECADDGASLGADVPVCRHGQAARMSGIGDVIDPVTLPKLQAVLINPGIHVPTPVVFKTLNKKNNAAMDGMPSSPEGIMEWLGDQRNDLQDAALLHAPVIADVLAALAGCEGQTLTRMSGSGATCFALFDTTNAARSAAHILSQNHPQWWVQPCALS